MFPTDSEFLTLYALYLGWLLFLLAGVLFSRGKRRYVINLVFYLAYIGIMVYIFSDKQNFKYGGSLAVLFYGGAFLLTHLFIFIGYSIYRYLSFRKKRQATYK